jgi:hypothetical protein
MNKTRTVIATMLAAATSVAYGSPLGWTYAYYDLGANFTPTHISLKNGYIVGHNSSTDRDEFLVFGGGTVEAPAVVPLLAGEMYQDGSTPVCVNNYGNIVGTDLENPKAYEWNLVTGGAVTALPETSPNHGLGFAYTINNVNTYGSNTNLGGQIAGMDVDADGTIWYDGAGALPSVYDNPNNNGGETVTFMAMNDHNVCLCSVPTNNYWNGALGSVASAVSITALNNSNEISGSYDHPTNAAPASTYNPTACVWNSLTGQPSALDNAANWSSVANSLNSSEYVVGTLSVAGNGFPQAFLWTSTYAMVNLNTAGVVSPALPTGVTLMSGLAIDDQGYGDIVGTSQVVVNHVPNTHAFLLIPNSQPDILALLLR